MDTAPDSVFETVTEEEYMDLVDSRRAREDFVVDDDGLGYHDDGEEYLGDEAGIEADGRKTDSGKRTGSSAIDEKTLKRARKLNRAARGDDDEEEGGGDGTMWNFAKKGSEATADASVEMGGDKRTKGGKKSKAGMTKVRVAL